MYLYLECNNNYWSSGACIFSVYFKLFVSTYSLWDIACILIQEDNDCLLCLESCIVTYFQTFSLWLRFSLGMAVNHLGLFP